MLTEILRIGLAVASNIREAIRLGGIRPPVVAVRIEVVGPTLAQLGWEGGDADRRLRQGLLGGLQDALAINCRDVDADFGLDGSAGEGRGRGTRRGD